tara:strand:+ start:218 stop:403 length:186 start_codon:yes stop_codon:yes gene_type:complete
VKWISFLKIGVNLLTRRMPNLVVFCPMFLNFVLLAQNVNQNPKKQNGGEVDEAFNGKLAHL